MAYKIKRPIGAYYIPLSDKIEKQLDNERNAGGRKGEGKAPIYTRIKYEDWHKFINGLYSSIALTEGDLKKGDKGFYLQTETKQIPVKIKDDLAEEGYYLITITTKKGKGWHERTDPTTGKAKRHHDVKVRGRNKGALKSPIKKGSSKPEWYQDTEANNEGEEYKVWKTLYKGLWATVYPVGKKMGSDTEGWEYELYREKPLAEYDSLFDSSTGGDHAKDKETAMDWAINTINGWGK